jgi:hypothetical protein
MAGRKCPQGFLLFCTLGMLCWVSALAAGQAQPGFAGARPAGASPKAKITDVLFLQLSPVPSAELSAPAARAKLISVIPKVSFLLAIRGENLPCTTSPEVLLQTRDPGKPVEKHRVLCLSHEEIHVSGEAAIGTVITSVMVTTGGCKEVPAAGGDGASPGVTAVGDAATKTPASAGQKVDKCTQPGRDDAGDSSCNTATSTGLTISIQPITQQSALQEFGIRFHHHQSKEFPNLHSLLVTKQSGDPLVGFDANPNHMSIDLEPTGTTDLRVMQSNEQQMELHFVAAPDYVPTNVVITVYDKSDLDTRMPRFVGKVMATSRSPTTDANEPAITSVEIVFLDRHEGNGRIRIYGKGFAKKVEAPPYPVDDFLCDCLERPPLGLPQWERLRTCGRGGKELGRESRIPLEQEGLTPLEQAALGRLEEGKVKKLDGEQRTPQEKDEIKKRWGDTRRRQLEKENLTDLEKKQLERSELQQLEKDRQDYCGIQENGNISPGGRLDEWIQWQCKLGIAVGANSRNADIRVEKAEIININDKMIDVYFEFTRHRSYAWPFRLASVDLTIPVTAKKVEQVVTLPSANATGEVDAATATTVHLFRAIDPQPDAKLTYRYTVLSYGEVQNLLGDGVADNFHVVELAVVNDGAKKVAVPLAGMQAEIEWLYGRDRDTRGFFLEGPATLPPVPMATVSAYFGASKKKTERRVWVFNALEGITTLVGALIPLAGIGLKNAEVVFSSGFIPGLQHVWVDISDQQLQNLTALSWQTSETLAANGGSMQKLIYIQRGQQFKGDVQNIYTRTFTLQQMADIMGLEVTGYEINDSPAKQATPADKSSTSGAKTSTISRTTSDATGTTTEMTTSESSSAPP